MGTGSLEGDVVTLDSVDQQPVGFEVTLAVADPLALERMIIEQREKLGNAMNFKEILRELLSCNYKLFSQWRITYDFFLSMLMSYLS